jgi:hypothetical protein
MTKTVQSGYFAPSDKSEKDLIPNKPKTKNNMRLLRKLTSVSIAFVFLAFMVFSIISIRSVQTTSFAEYRPIFTENGKDVIGILAVGKEMTTIGKTINSNTVRYIKKIAAAAFAVFLASIAVYTIGYKFILSKPVEQGILKKIPEYKGGPAKRLTVSGKIEWR